MSCNSAIYTVNNTNQAVTTSDDAFVQVPFGSVVRRFGKALQLDGGSIVAFGSGYFDCEASLSVSPTAIGTISAQLYQDGNPVPGAIATGYASTAGNPVTLPISALVRNCGCDCNSTLSVRVNASCTVNNLAVVVEKV